MARKKNIKDVDEDVQPLFCNLIWNQRNINFNR